MYVCRGLAKMVPSDVTMPMPILLAEPSKRMAILRFFISFGFEKQSLSAFLQRDRTEQVNM